MRFILSGSLLKKTFIFVFALKYNNFFGVTQLGWSNNFAKRKSKQLQYLYHLNLRQQVVIEKILLNLTTVKNEWGWSSTSPTSCTTNSNSIHRKIFQNYKKGFL